MSTDTEARLQAAFRAAAEVIGEPQATEPHLDSRSLPGSPDRDGRWLNGWVVPLAVAAVVLLVLAGSIGLINDVRSGRPAHQPTSSATPTSSAPTSSAPTSSATPTASSTGSPPPIPVLAGPSVGSAQLLPSGAGYARTDTAVLATSDYGASWTRVTPSGLTTAQLASAAITFRPDGTLVIAVPAPNGQLITVYRRVHGAWAQATVPAPGQPSLSFSDNKHGWLVAGQFITHIAIGVAFWTEDGGATWVKKAVAMQEAGPVTALSPSDGFLTLTMNGWTFASHDAGATWNRFTLAPPPGKQGDTLTLLGQPAVAGSAVVIAAQFSTADVGNPDGIGLYRSDDHGLTWRWTRTLAMQADESDVFTLQPDGSYVLLRSLLPAPGGSRIWTVSISSDGGRTFRDGPSTAQLGDPETLWSAGDGRLWVLTSDNGCRNGKSDCHATTGILATSDGGASWQQLRLPG